jgi:eukaryotic-like serine/threonine-protein kinase
MSTSAPSLDALRRTLGGRYGIERELGRGGMGAVYLARDLELDRPVALKVLPPEFALVPDLRERFIRETRTAASFSHPNIVPVFSIEDRDGLLAFAMGYVEGESLGERVKRSGPLSVRELVRMLQDIGYALAYAHGRGVVHRDIKPDNIMLERATGRALLMDFGISRTITTQVATPGLTRVGEVVGTPEFMSPEQASGDTIDGRSDLYSLGLVAWFAATGVLAISGDSTQKIIVRQLTEAIPAVGAQRADLPAALADAIDRCVRKEPDERFANAEALVETLDAAQMAMPEVPLPIRMFAEEASTSGLVLIGGSVMGALLYKTLSTLYDGNLDILLPVVLFAAALWGRMALTISVARRLAQRGFGVDEIQRGLTAILAEHDADRAQLKADPLIVARRRRQIAIQLALLASTFGVTWYVMKFQRIQTKPDYYVVNLPGAISLYAAYVTRGISIVGLARSPFRRPIGERLFRWFWVGAPGRFVLRMAARRVAGGAAAAPRTPASASAAEPYVTAAVLHSTAAPSAFTAEDAPLAERVRRLEQRMDAVEER